MKYAWIRQHRDLFSVTAQCQALQVSTSGYYAWVDRLESPRARRHARIQQAVRQVHAKSHGIYGSRKIAVSLRDQPELEAACRNTVAQAMRTLGLKSRLVRRFTPTTTQADHNTSARTERSRSRLHGDGSQSPVGDGPHVPGDHAGLGLPSGRTRPVQSQSGGLGDESVAGHGTCLRSPAPRGRGTPPRRKRPAAPQ